MKKIDDKSLTTYEKLKKEDEKEQLAKWKEAHKKDVKKKSKKSRK